MAQRHQGILLLRHRNLRFIQWSLAVSLGIVCGSELVAATPVTTTAQLAQQQESTSQDPNRAAAERASAEAWQLFQQGTAESKRQAIAKYEEALQRWRAVGDRSQEASALHGIGLVYYSLGEKQKALDYYTQALALRRTLNNRAGEAWMLWAIAGVYSDLGQKQQALDSYNQALTLFRAVSERSGEALTLNSLGNLYLNLGETQKAVDTYNQALTIQRAAGDRSGEANTFQQLGRLYLVLGEPQKALDSFNQALSLFRDLGERSQEASILNLLGLVYFNSGENQKALDFYNQALPLLRAEGDRGGEAIALQALGGVYNSLGERQKALDTFERSLTLLREIGNRSGEAEALNNMGVIYRQLGENQQALNSYNQALRLLREEKNPSREAFTLNSIAGIYKQLGETQQALDSHNQALQLFRKVGDVEGEADTLSDISEVYQLLGEYQLSLASYNQTLSLYRKTGNISGEAKTLDTMGQVYRSLEEYQKALDSSNQALAMWRKQNDRPRQIATLTTIVRTYESLGNYQQALDAANQIMALGNESSDRFLQATGFTFLGRVYRGLGEYQKALDSFNQGLSLMQAMKFRQAEPPILENIGKVYDQLDQPQKAIEAHNQALSIWQGIGDRRGEAESLYSIAGVERKRGNLDAAKKQIESVINIVESLRSKVVSQELRTSYFASVQKYYQFYIDLLMQLHKTTRSKGYDALALQASERARARSLLELLTEAKANIRQGVDPTLLQQERTLQQKLDAVEKRRIELVNGKDSNTQVEALEKETAALLEEYRQVQAEIRRTSPRYAALTQPQTLTLTEIQQQVLDDDTILLEYSLGEERSYLWAVTKTNITSYELPKRTEIEAAARQFYRLLNTPNYRLGEQRSSIRVEPTSPVTKAVTNLSQMLLEPVAQQLGKKRLLIVSDGALQYVPFSALPLPGTSGKDVVPLLVKHEIVNLPSASTLAVLRHELSGRQTAAKTLAVIADPIFSSNDERVKKSGEGQNLAPPQPANGSSETPNDVNSLVLARSARELGVTFDRLPFTRTEGDRILSLVPTDQKMQAFDFAASRTTATNPQLSQYQIVHFATHGILNSKNPELSGIVLSLVDEKGTPQNGFLRLQDIFNLNLPAELIVLSACETGLGQDVKGEGLVGLTRGFMYAGSPRVMVSLWSVDDEGTSELMSRFYKKMLQAGQQPSAALRAAQIEMWQEKKWQAPYYWAAFTLQGEWR